ncbi:neuropeptide-like 1 isoform X2 [Cloeon dipterum]|uniref:neuropeptide-like 1 isoform X2 n=1 Tax=Cloeon dipterum TaxID=197152 RepID=UPI00322010E2
MADASATFALLALALLVAVNSAQGQYDDEFPEEKRRIASLARNGDLPSFGDVDMKRFAHPLSWRRQEEEKRVVHPMSHQRIRERLLEEEKRFSHPVTSSWNDARDAEEDAERKLIAELLDEEIEKRMGVATLARSGSLPGKRNIAAMARDGYLTQHTRNSQDGSDDADVEDEPVEIDEIAKRNVAALARNFQMPFGGKRNVAARARQMSRYAAVKRNIATLLRSRVGGKRQPYAFARLSGIRDDVEEEQTEQEKRNIQAILRTMRPPGNTLRNRFARSFPPMLAALMARGQKDDSKRHLGSVLATTGRRKRSALHDPMELTTGGAEYPVLSYEYEYEEVPQIHEDKRFLGRIPHMGRTTSGRSSGGQTAPSRRRPREA